MLITRIPKEANEQAYMTLMYFSGISFAIFLIGIDGPDTGMAIFFEVLRFFSFLVGLVFSMNFFVNQFPNIKGVKALLITIVYTGILAISLFYWIAKLIDMIRMIVKHGTDFYTDINSLREVVNYKKESLLPEMEAGFFS